MNYTAKEVEAFHNEVKAVSDLFPAYNPKTNEYDIPAIEWDTCYGRWLEKFETEADRDAALESHQAFMVEWITEYRERVKQLAIEKGKRIAAERRKIKEAKTIGGMFPQLAELRTALASS